MAELTHLDQQGNAQMVDVTTKEVTEREATAEATLLLPPAAYTALKEGNLKKGDAFSVARIAGIMAAKKTGDLIPLCHPLPITGVTVDFEMLDSEHRVRIVTSSRIAAQTGVEMEAMTAASLAALTIYDMCKGVDKGIIIENVRLLSKKGGKSGTYQR